MVSNDNTEGGNSGGPVFIKTTSGWEVVALVSGSNYAKGRFVPIAVIP
jgi:V8-like Glu-specific endopeptidase